MNIALTGKLRSGKDSIGNYLCESYGYTRFAFGDELKRYAHELFGVTGAKQRELYQWFGQTMRSRDPDIWVRKCFDAIDIGVRARKRRPDLFDGPQLAVITDLRQPNEFARCRSEGFVIIRVNCPDSHRIAFAQAAGDDFTLADLGHETESHVDTFAVDYDVYNVGTIDELYAQIDAIMTKLGVKKEAID